MPRNLPWLLRGSEPDEVERGGCSRGANLPIDLEKYEKQSRSKSSAPMNKGDSSCRHISPDPLTFSTKLRTTNARISHTSSMKHDPMDDDKSERMAGQYSESDHRALGSNYQGKHTRFRDGGFEMPQTGKNSQEIDQLQNLLKSASERNTVLETIITTMITEKAASDKTLKKCQAELRELKSHVEAANDTQFKLLPTAQISDSQIGEEYRHLCTSIEDWIDTSFPDLTNALMCIEKQLGARKGLHAFGGGFLESTEHNMMICFRGAEYSIVRRFIQRVLDHFLFDRHNYFVGLDQAENVWLEEIERGMRDLEPRLEEDVIHEWRSNTLRAITTNQEYQQGLEEHLDRVAECVCQLLTPLFAKGSDVQKAMERFVKRVAEPAANLASNMRKHPQVYYLTRPCPQKTIAFAKDHLKIARLIDAETDQPALASRFSLLKDDDPVGEEIFMIHPALFREEGEDREDILVGHPTFLVEFIKI